MQIELPDSIVDALRDALTPTLDRLIAERVEQGRPLLLSLNQVADELSCSRSSVYGLIHGGHLEAIRIGRSYRVATVTLQDYVEELTRSPHQREIVTARTRPARTSPSARPARQTRGSPSQAPFVVPATQPPRAPRQVQKKPSKAEVAESRCTVAEFADRWWGLDSATALLERSGVAVESDSSGQVTFRYGDLIEWMEHNRNQFEKWTTEFDPGLKRRSAADDDV